MALTQADSNFIFDFDRLKLVAHAEEILDSDDCISQLIGC